MVKTQIDVKRAIMESGKSMAEVAEATGIDRSNISKLWTKTGDKDPNPTLLKLLAVAEAIGKDITELFYPVDGSPVAQPKVEQVAEQTAVAVEKPQEAVAEHIGGNVFMCPHCQEKFALGVSLVPLK